MKIFVLGVPHTQTRVEFNTCAFTMKAWNLCKMLDERGHEVIHLGVEGSNPPCRENVAVVPESMWRELYGHPGNRQYNTDSTGKYKPLHDLFAANARRAILERTPEPNTAILACTWGGAQQIATNDLPQFQVETGIGYRYTFAKFRVFESYAWMHMHWGKEDRFAGDRWYDVVIPNAFDPDMFEYVPRENKGDYFLYVGRLNDDKGIGIAIDVSKRLGVPLKLAGQGDPARFLQGNPNVEYLGPLNVADRNKAMGKARCGFVPTRYVEPFGGVNVEFQMCGTPVIATDWGAFPETVLHGVTGYRCRTLEQFVWAAKNIDKIDPKMCRMWAVNNFSLQRVVLMYEEFFQQVLNLKGAGWPIEFPEREQLDWLTKNHPQAIKSVSFNIKHKAPNLCAPAVLAPKSEWEEAQDWERDWWGLERDRRWEDEERKQLTYARMMGIASVEITGAAIEGGPIVSIERLDAKMKFYAKGARILDIGCGPISMMLRCIDLGVPSVGIDPLAVSEATRKTYADRRIVFLNEKIETVASREPRGSAYPDVLAAYRFDEVWVYNCLQHVEDLPLVLKVMGMAAPAIRLFEWVDLGKCPGHPQNLTEDLFLAAFPGDRWDYKIWNTGILRGFGGTATNKYLAFHIVGRTTETTK